VPHAVNARRAVGVSIDKSLSDGLARFVWPPKYGDLAL
jgi:hypothetical protein